LFGQQDAFADGVEEIVEDEATTDTPDTLRMATFEGNWNKRLIIYIFLTA
jgi:hypothetical protein